MLTKDVCTKATMKVGFAILLIGCSTLCSGFSSTTKLPSPPRVVRRTNNNDLLMIGNTYSPSRGYDKIESTSKSATKASLTSPLSSKTTFITPPPLSLTQQRAPITRPDAGHSLHAVSIGTTYDELLEEKSSEQQVAISTEDFVQDLNEKKDESNVGILTVLSTALLITGNTVGAGSLVLPELAQGPGMGITTLIFLGCFVLNLVSGLALAEVAINQYETSGNDVPSSFKEFVQASLMPATTTTANDNDNDMGAPAMAAAAATFISVVSLFVNSCVLAFDFARFGEVGEALLQNVMTIDPVTLGVGSAGILAVLMGTLSSPSLSNVTSMFVTALFLSFAGLILPGLNGMENPIVTTLMAPGNDMSFHTIQHMTPIILMSMIYQNIVPTVTKILGYDRTKTMTSIVLGSFLPLVMYVVWCFCSLGGGIDTNTIGGPLITIFTLATLSGSAVGTGMSVAEECEAFLQNGSKGGNEEEIAAEADDNSVFSLPAVAASVGIPLLGYLAFAGYDFTEALKIGGSLGSPLLYGVIPAFLAWNQRKAIQSTTTTASSKHQLMVPGGILSLGTLGLLSTGYVGEELISNVGGILM